MTAISVDSALSSTHDEPVSEASQVTSTMAPATVLERRLQERTENDPRFWDFQTIHGREGGHGYFQYPAMMVPELQRALLEDLLASDDRVKTVYDPFMGSGTILLESLYLGLDFVGGDINPMAVLLSQVKAHPPASDEARAAGERVLQLAKALRKQAHVFDHRDKWFKTTVSDRLSRLRAAIRREEDRATRRFLWVCLAETVRFVSNSRGSTFKLHLYDAGMLASRKPDPFTQFESVLKDNVERIEQHESEFPEAVPRTQLYCGDVKADLTLDPLADAIMTSPPYGDNHTTVPYGQYSYLPLQWIDSTDLVGDVDPQVFSKPGRLDSLSLGGRRLTPRPVPDDLASDVPSLVAWLAEREAKTHTTQKVVTFVEDYRQALRAAEGRLRPGGFTFLTLGERRVDGASVPLVAFTREILESAGHTHVASIRRLLPTRKRMAVRNTGGQTMLEETILVLQKQG